MSPVEQNMATLAKRYYCSSGYYDDGYGCRPYSAWQWWGRWVLTGVVILGIIALLIMLGRVNARRRRNNGMVPMYGTGWMGGKYNGAPPPPPGPGQNNPGVYYPPPPKYSAQPVPNQYTGTTFNPNDGYYGGHTEGVQPPPNAYAPPHRDSPAAGAGDNVYAPPPGPPPGK